MYEPYLLLQGDGVRRFKDIYLLDTHNVLQIQQAPPKPPLGSPPHRGQPVLTPRNVDISKEEPNGTYHARNCFNSLQKSHSGLPLLA